MGGWSHPEISLEELMKLIKGFVDIIILASGYQSTGHFAHWDPLNIKKAFQWAIFFENVFKSIDINQDSIDELDAALSKLTSDPYFPQGLKHISSATLSKARIFILQHLTRTLPMRDAHLKAILKATIEMDLDELQRTEIDYLDVYLHNLTLQNEEGVMDFSPSSYMKSKNETKTDFTTLAIQGITKRQLLVSRVSSIETSANVVAKTITHGNSNEIKNHWRKRILLYFLEKRTIRLVSGAKMIFSVPKVQWVQVFERLDTSIEANDNFCETIELLLVGCISSQWNNVIHHFISNSHELYLSISTLYEGVHNLILGKFQNADLMQEIKNSKEVEIAEYLEVKLSNQIHRLWELPPALAAAALPSWSRLFEVYVSELLSQFKGKTSNIRCCSCIDDNKEHTECEIAERIWSWDTTEETLNDYFTKYGHVSQSVIMRDKTTGRPRGFEFVFFSDPSVLDTADLWKLKEHYPEKNSKHLDLQITLEGALEGQEITEPKRFLLTEEQFRQYFETFGDVTDVVIMFDQNTSRPRGFGFISFDTEDAVDRVFQKMLLMSFGAFNHVAVGSCPTDDVKC